MRIVLINNPVLRVHRCVTCHDYFDCSDANCVEPPFAICGECRAEEDKKGETGGRIC